MTKSKDLITSYREDLLLLRTSVRKFWMAVLIAVLMILPWICIAFGGNYAVYLLGLTAIFTIVTLGLNLLTGATGLVSFGHAAFFAVGAYTAGILAVRLSFPFWLGVPLAAVNTALVGVIVGLPALRLKGVYLALSTLAAQFIVTHLILQWDEVTGGPNGLSIPPPSLGPLEVGDPIRFYYLAVPTAVLLAFGVANLMRSRVGRALLAVRDSETAAETMGVSLRRYKALSFAISAGYAGVAGGLFAFYMSYIGPDNFTIFLSVEFVLMIIIGGLGSILGSVLGALFVTLLPECVRVLEGVIHSWSPNLVLPDLKNMILGLSLVLVIVFQPEGFSGLWRNVKRYWTTWPF